MAGELVRCVKVDVDSCCLVVVSHNINGSCFLEEHDWISDPASKSWYTVGLDFQSFLSDKEEGKLAFSEKPLSTRISAQELLKEDPLIRGIMIRRLIKEIAGRLKDIGNIHIAQTEALLDKPVGKRVSLPYGIVAYRDYEDIVLESCVSAGNDPEQSLKTGRTEAGKEQTGIFLEKSKLERYSFDAPLTLEWKCREDAEPVIFSLYIVPRSLCTDFTKNLYTKCFDCDKIKNGVSIRSRRSGDFLLIHSSSGALERKKLKNWFIDNKVPQGMRDELPIVAEDSHVLWIAGKRRDDSCFVEDDTERVLVIEIHNNFDRRTS